MIAADSTSYMAYHIVHDALTWEIISEDSFMYRGNFPLFMCGCYSLSCEGDCPPLLDHELALKIRENRIKADTFDDNIRKFKEANLNNAEKNRQQHKF